MAEEIAHERASQKRGTSTRPSTPRAVKRKRLLLAQSGRPKVRLNGNSSATHGQPVRLCPVPVGFSRSVIEVSRLSRSVTRPQRRRKPRKPSYPQWAAYYREPELSLDLLIEVTLHLSHPAMLWHPLSRDVRRLPGFKKLVRDLGFVDYWQVYGWSDF